MAPKACRIILLAVAIAGCAPAVAERCSIDERSLTPLRAIATVTNRSADDIVSLEFLVSARRSTHLRGNRLFASHMLVRAHETRVVTGQSSSRYGYDFKDPFLGADGCELEVVRYASGADWYAPSPL